MAEEFARDEAGKDLLRVINLPLAFFKSFAAPPGTSEPELATLRTGFAAMFKDQEFLADVEKLKAEAHYATGDQVVQSVQQILNASPQTVEQIKKVVKP
jgi:tripartite-type tricarboxylate transporter receptor subunit TctC